MPAKNETVSLIAKTADGCLAHDTLRISTLLPKPVSLGLDRYICASDSAVLSTGDIFPTYLWSTGQQTSTIDVTKAGEYWVQTIDESGCRSHDTINVQVYNLPYFNLGSDFDLCKNEHRQLDPGSFNQYAWQDGSSNRYFVVAAVGTYWVKVTDANGCSFSDTVALKNILPLPVDFLKQSDSICQYAQLKIVPLKTFSSYSWSTGSSQSSVTVDRPGSYGLKVTDANGCQGTDTITVNLKNCNYGIWVPSAFTPNNDGKNDVFRPLLFGNVLNYRFIIYDRWGQKVFETTDLSKGWDGKLNGNPESSFVFVWQCFYQFVGGNPSFQKGTVTLVH